MQDSFLKACCTGKLEEAQELYINNKINIRVKNDEAFRFACEYGHIEIAKWLFNLDNKINIHA